jgi:hypothetical protein
MCVLSLALGQIGELFIVCSVTGLCITDFL